MQLGKARYVARAGINSLCGPLSRILVVILTTAASLPPPATVLAQQPGRMDAQASVKASAIEDKSIRPFRVNVPQESLDDLRRVSRGEKFSRGFS